MRVPCEPPDEVFGRPLRHYAHQADIVRLKSLLKTGGIYLDIDTICCRSFDDLLVHPCVLGLQRDPIGVCDGLCNAVILSEPGSTFLQEWFDSYRSFRADGCGQYWDEHSVRVPWRLAQITPEGRAGRPDLHVEPAESFFIEAARVPISNSFSNESASFRARIVTISGKALAMHVTLRRLPSALFLR